MPDISPKPVAFEEAIAFLEKKVRLPSRRSDDLKGAIHAKAFTIAGATKAQLLADLHQEVVANIKAGRSIGEFIKGFDEAVNAHGWSYKGKRGWRARVIYDTNMRAAHMAGRWAKFQETKGARPYLQYLTAGDSRVREEHRKWDRKVLAIDDEWWNTHFPPNDFGCRCTVRSLSQSQMEREGLTVSEPPPDKPTERVNARTGEVYGMVPEGVGVGWDYNVGKAWLGPDQALGEAVAQLPPRVRSSALDALQAQSEVLAKPFAVWAQRVLDERGSGATFATGYLSSATFNGLVERGVVPSSATVAISEEPLRSLQAELDGHSDKAVRRSDLAIELSAHLASPVAVLWDKKAGALVYVTQINGSPSQRLVVVVGPSGGGHPFNEVTSGAVVGRRQLRDSARYEVIEGEP